MMDSSKYRNVKYKKYGPFIELEYSKIQWAKFIKKTFEILVNINFVPKTSCIANRFIAPQPNVAFKMHRILKRQKGTS